ncbi:MAG: hypothetical protein Q4C63_03125 [Eubacteriales bacterium]|nr:hypothetical protein [Eubacteriales bacterium]
MKNALHKLLIMSCAFLTGCNSIIYNGNLHFKSFEPETVPGVSDYISGKLYETSAAEDYARYEIAGTNAFYILPEHENRPDEMLDFKVLDYTEDGSFIYAYLTPAYKITSNGLADGTGREGRAPEERVMTNGGTSTKNALVLMSYTPETRAYKVFYSAADSVSSHRIPTDEEKASGESAAAGAAEQSLMTNRLVKVSHYFIFHNNIAYVYDQKGNELLHHDYSTVISQEIDRLKQKAREALKKNHEDDEVEESLNSASAGISDVVMDGNHYVYIPITVELPETGDTGSTDSGDDDFDVEEEELAQTVYSSVVSCYDMDIGGRDNPVRFVSYNQVFDRQVEIWKSYGDKSIFEAMINLVMGKPSMDSIKLGLYGGTPDDFTVYRTEDHTGLNMELAGVPNILEPELWWVYSSSGYDKITLRPHNLNYGYVSDPENTLEFPHPTMNDAYFELLDSSEKKKAKTAELVSFYWGENMVKSEFKVRFRETVASIFSETLARIAANNETVRKAAGLGSRGYYLIPWLKPGQYIGGYANRPPYTQAKGELEALYAYRTSLYQGSGSLQKVSRYASIEFPNRYNSIDHAPVLEQRPIAYGSGTASRTIYAVEKTGEDEDGEDIYEYVKKTEVLDLSKFPIAYQLVFPEGTRVTWVESYDTDEMVTASGDLGVLFYTDMEADSTAQDAKCKIRYNNGESADALSDSNVPGQAMDAGVLYYDGSAGETEMTVFVTDQGVKFYWRNGESYSGGKTLYLTLESLAQAVSGYGLTKTGGSSLTEDASASGQISVGKEQDAIINQRSESGSSSDSYTVSGFTLLNDRDVIVSSLTGGIRLLNTDNSLSISLKTGAYYSAFSYEKNGSRRFMVVGFDTEEYAYKPGDIAMAKCYDMDLEAENARLESEALIAELDRLSDGYLTRTHRLQYNESTKAYEIVQPTDAEKKENERAIKLFYGTTEAQNTELSALAREYGFAAPSEETKEHARELREKRLLQREKLTEFYRLAGLSGITGLPTEAWLLEEEGMLISANYVDSLENILVDIRLSNAAISAMPAEKQAEYRAYQTQKAAALKLNDRTGIQSPGGVSGLEEGSDVTAEQMLSSMQQAYGLTLDELSAIENMSCYDTVLSEIRTAYEEAAGEESSTEPPDNEEAFSDYLRFMLLAISPDSAVNHQLKGISEFCALSGIDETLTDTDALLERITTFSRVRELKELMVELKLGTAAYQSSSYRKEFSEYQEQSFSTEAEKMERFENAGFYEIIRQIEEQAEPQLQNTTFEQKLRDILGLCTEGIILD